MNVIISTIDRILNFGKANSLQGLLFGSSCCSAELSQRAFSDYDFSSYGLEISNVSPKEADLLICTGVITAKMAPKLQEIYQQMPEPKYIIAFGSCAVSGGSFYNSYNVIQGIDKVLPVDIYLPGCPPKPEELIEAVAKLKKGIHDSSFLNRKEELKRHNCIITDSLKDANNLQADDFEVNK